MRNWSSWRGEGLTTDGVWLFKIPLLTKSVATECSHQNTNHKENQWTNHRSGGHSSSSGEHISNINSSFLNYIPFVLVNTWYQWRVFLCWVWILSDLSYRCWRKPLISFWIRLWAEDWHYNFWYSCLRSYQERCYRALFFKLFLARRACSQTP